MSEEILMQFIIDFREAQVRGTLDGFLTGYNNAAKKAVEIMLKFGTPDDLERLRDTFLYCAGLIDDETEDKEAN